MTQKKTDDQGELENNTATELNVLANIEKSFYRANDSAKRRNTAKSLKWFSRYIPKNYSRVRTARLFRDRSLTVDMIRPGDMYFAAYDPIHKDSLPFYDEFPILLPWDMWQKNGHTYIISINLHFLHPSMRFAAMKALLKLRNEKRYRSSTKMKISWQVLKGLSNSKYFEHCVRIYRLDHFRTKFVKIPPRSWEMAVFLPVARIKGDKSKAMKV